MQVYVSISFLLQYTLFSFLFDLEVCQSAVLKQNVKNSPASIDPIVESCGLKELFFSSYLDPIDVAFSIPTRV